MYDKIMTGVEETEGLKKTLFQHAFAVKQENLHANDNKHRLWDALVFSKVSGLCLLGGRGPRVCKREVSAHIGVANHCVVAVATYVRVRACRSKRSWAWRTAASSSLAPPPSPSTSWSFCALCLGAF